LRCEDSHIIVDFCQMSSVVSPTGPPERSTGIQNIQSTDPLTLRLIEVAGLRRPCDLDLLLFFSRHPRVVLSSEQLALYVGYDLPEVARALDLLLGAGLLKRTLHRGAPGRMYVLEVDRAEEWLELLRRVCATPDGRNALKTLLRERRPPPRGAEGEPGPISIRGR
jgi:hypothetical protein